jgi:predicted metal-dependent hydrolase
MNRTFSTESGTITLSIQRKAIKNLYLRVLPPEGRVCVTAPLQTSDMEIRRFVASRMDWIQKQREKFASVVKPRYETGDSIPYFGKLLTLEVLPQPGRTKVSREGSVLTLKIRPEADEAMRKRAIDACTGWNSSKRPAQCCRPANGRSANERASSACAI